VAKLATLDKKRKFFFVLFSLNRNFAPEKQRSGLPLVVTREESPGSAGHSACENTSSRQRLEMGEENDRPVLF
jgi:hypothetical protein